MTNRMLKKTNSLVAMTRKKDKYSHFDKSLLKDGTKIPGSENWTTSPRDWEGYLDRKGKDILWELEETNIPELQKVIETKGFITSKSSNE